ncbi:MAG TPA: arginine--tRNA ligase [Candidatus Saccharimonadia bacterium]|jgi:arginyl-tRNA synthetase
MIANNLKQHIEQAIAKTFGADLDMGRFSVDFTDDPQFGDITTNAAMVYAKDLKLPPREAAEQLAAALRDGLKEAAKVEVAGPGFINIILTDEVLSAMAVAAPLARPRIYEGQEVVAEYSDPNPFKVLHAGHLYTSVVGDAIANLLENAGAKVHRVNFGGDVGLHVAKTLWAMLRELGGEHPEKLKGIREQERPEWMAKCYVDGTAAYEDSEEAKRAIIELNRRVYQIHADDDKTSALAQIYWTCREWSYEGFDKFYARIGTKFEKYYPESSVAELGLKTVQEQLKKGVFEHSDGAVIFDGEKYGLHTRVFINSQGIPTYEAKDVGLIMQKWEDYHFNRSVVITGNEQEQYMAVVLKAVEQFAPELTAATNHLTHGMVKLKGGVKMSSRKGNILRATDVLEAAAEANKELTGQDNEQTVLGAVKYAFLKNRMGGDLIYDPEESVSLEGKSGPYLQYAHARARSILAKVGDRPVPKELHDLDSGERVLARKLVEYPGVVAQAAVELMPHLICTYLYELAQVFNRFYEANRVMGDDREEVRLRLVGVYAEMLSDGLALLGIAAPDRL